MKPIPVFFERPKGGIIMDDIREIKITVPEGMEIDRENSTFECIKFKPIKSKRWRDNKNAKISGYYTTANCYINHIDDSHNTPNNYNIFAIEKQAKSAIAMAHISQIMANDERFGGVVTDEEWNSNINKYVIERIDNSIQVDCYSSIHHFLAFHTIAQRNLFLKENEDLVKDYLMIE